MCPCVGVARGHVQHPELEAGRPSLKLGLGWSQGAAAEQKVACCVEWCRVPIDRGGAHRVGHRQAL